MLLYLIDAPGISIITPDYRVLLFDPCYALNHLILANTSQTSSTVLYSYIANILWYASYPQLTTRDIQYLYMRPVDTQHLSPSIP